jgi:hypothetical protein
MWTAWAIHVKPRKVAFQGRTLLVHGSCKSKEVIRCFSQEVDPIFDTQSFFSRLHALAPSIASSLLSNGFWTNTNTNTHVMMLRDEEIRAMRTQCIALRSQGRFEQSWSERMDDQGVATRFDKEGVFACEPDGTDYHTAPDILLYMSTLISTLPPLLNEHVNATNNSNNSKNNSGENSTTPLQLSNRAYNAKLAVTSPGGSTYPLHIDNTLGITGSPQDDDSRKLTCILYLNPDYVQGDGGELRLLLLEKTCLDLTPCGGRMVIFWSDEIPHQVLACKPDSTDAAFDRFALTIWLPDTDPRNIQQSASKFSSLRLGAFDGGETWC